MKKATILGSVLALALTASAQSITAVGPQAHVGPTAVPSKRAANATVNVPPVANPGPVAVPHPNPNAR